MNKNNFLFTLICTILFVIPAKSQLNDSFLKHLSESGLKAEHQAYLSQLQLSPDSLQYLKAKFHLQYGNDSLFFGSIDQSKNLVLNDSNFVYLATKRYFLEKQHFRDQWIQYLGNDYEGKMVKELLKMKTFSEVLNSRDTIAIPEELYEDYFNLRKISNKKAGLALIFSSVIPGLGKLYIGKIKSFVSFLLINTIHTLQTYESIRKLGIWHPLSIANVGVFGVFYVSNIYGSYKDVKVMKKEAQRQFLNHAANYFLAESPILYN